MSKPFKTDNPELEALFERYRNAPRSQIFAPLADGCRKAGMLEEAIEICEKGVSLHPNYASGFVVRGKCYYDIGNSDQAEASFEKVLELDGNNLVALKYMGLILAERGQAREARGRFEHILALDPEDKEIAAKLAELGDPDASIDVALARELNEVLGDESVADARRNEDVPETAESTAGAEPVELRAIEDESFVGAEITLGDGGATPDVLATMTLADIYAVQGFRKKAIKIYSELLESQPGHPGVTEKLRELGVGQGEPSVPSEPVAAADEPDDLAAATDEPVESSDEDVEKADEPEAETSDEETPVLESASVSSEQPPPGENPRNAAHFKRWLENFSR